MNAEVTEHFNLLEAWGKKYQLLVNKLFVQVPYSKMDRVSYQKNMVENTHSDGVFDDASSPYHLIGGGVPRDLIFSSAVAMHNRHVEMVKNARDTISSLLSFDKICGSSVKDLFNGFLKIEKPSTKNGAWVGNLYINDREFAGKFHNSNSAQHTISPDEDLHSLLLEKAEEAKQLRYQHFQYHYGWNQLIEDESVFCDTSAGNSAMVKQNTESMNVALESRLVSLKRELASIKLESIAKLATRHTTKDGRQLFDVSKVERISRRILFGVHQLIADCGDDMTFQRKLVKSVTQSFLFGDQKSGSNNNEYASTWNKYFTEIANGRLLVEASATSATARSDVAAVQSQFSAALAATLSRRLSEDRKLRCPPRNISTSSNSMDPQTPGENKVNSTTTYTDYLFGFLRFSKTVEDFFDQLASQWNSYESHDFTWMASEIDILSQQLFDKFDDFMDILMEIHSQVNVSVSNGVNAVVKLRIDARSSLLRFGKWIYHKMQESRAFTCNGMEKMDDFKDIMMEIYSQVNTFVLNGVNAVVKMRIDARSSLLGFGKCIYFKVQESTTFICDCMGKVEKFVVEELAEPTNCFYIGKCLPLIKRSWESLFVALDMIQTVLYLSYQALYNVVDVLCEVFINTPCSIVNALSNVLCLTFKGMWRLLEEFVVRIPIFLAKHIHQELPEDLQYATTGFGNLLLTYPHLFVGICYVVLYAFCMRD